MKVVYDETPEQMVKGLMPLLEAGANIVGACCGSTPEHIRAFRKVMDEFLESKGIELQGGQRESQTLRCEPGRPERKSFPAHRR
jgi:5-methyltetrahydrofolate--homocysteine methyltransferase